MKHKEFRLGVKDSIPVGIGYFAVSFGFGALAITYGLSVLSATLISATNLTSAGQFAGLTLIAEAASLIYIFLTQLLINSRYFLMSLALNQRLDSSFKTIHRMVISFFVTDEVFALAIKRRRDLTVPYMYGLGVLPILGWTLGTLCGALAGKIMPLSIRTALSMALYGMFIAIIVPPAKKKKSALVAVLLAALLSSLFTWFPLLNKVSSGLSILICTAITASICAWLFPVADQSDDSEDKEDML